MRISKEELSSILRKHSYFEKLRDLLNTAVEEHHDMHEGEVAFPCESGWVGRAELALMLTKPEPQFAHKRGQRRITTCSPVQEDHSKQPMLHLVPHSPKSTSKDRLKKSGSEQRRPTSRSRFMAIPRSRALPASQ